MAALKTSYLAGEIPEKPYLLAVDIMKKSLEILLKEKESLKKHLDLIESLEVIPLSPAVGLATQESKGQSEDQPMQVVVVE
ncbi:MAG: CdvA-like protein, partial [Desulfurococcaceae archaeon]